MAIHTSVDLQGLTWQDLYDFVDLARASGIPGGRRVEVISAEGSDEVPGCPERFEVDVHGPFAAPAAASSSSPLNAARDGLKMVETLWRHSQPPKGR